jgi:hypothetical protein
MCLIYHPTFRRLKVYHSKHYLLFFVEYALCPTSTPSSIHLNQVRRGHPAVEMLASIPENPHLGPVGFNLSTEARGN